MHASSTRCPPRPANSYIMLSGYPPFYGKTENEKVEKILSAKYDFGHAVWNDVSDVLMLACVSCILCAARAVCLASLTSPFSIPPCRCPTKQRTSSTSACACSPRRAGRSSSSRTTRGARVRVCCYAARTLTTPSHHQDRGARQKGGEEDAAQGRARRIEAVPRRVSGVVW
jgi:hypothetical protein